MSSFDVQPCISGACAARRRPRGPRELARARAIARSIERARRYSSSFGVASRLGALLMRLEAAAITR